MGIFWRLLAPPALKKARRLTNPKLIAEDAVVGAVEQATKRSVTAAASSSRSARHTSPGTVGKGHAGRSRHASARAGYPTLDDVASEVEELNSLTEEAVSSGADLDRDRVAAQIEAVVDDVKVVFRRQVYDQLNEFEALLRGAIDECDKAVGQYEKMSRDTHPMLLDLLSQSLATYTRVRGQLLHVRTETQELRRKVSDGLTAGFYPAMNQLVSRAQDAIDEGAARQRHDEAVIATLDRALGA
jgi:hypothetical protein